MSIVKAIALGGQISNEKVVFSLKTGSDFISKIATGNATIEFISEKECKIVTDSGEYIVKLSEARLTDTYIQPVVANKNDWQHEVFEFCGTCVGRMKVAKTDENVTFKSVVPTKRAISMIDPTSLPTSNSSQTKRPTLTKTPTVAPVVVTNARPLKQPPKVAILPWIHLADISVHTTPKDITKFFDPLKIQQIYVIPGSEFNSSVNTTSGVNGMRGDSKSGRVSVYVEFQSSAGSELAVERSGELMKFSKPQPNQFNMQSVSAASEWGSNNVDIKSNITNNMTISNNANNNTNTTMNTVTITEKQQVTLLTSEEESLWVSAVGFKLLSSNNNITTTISIQTRFHEIIQIFGENHVVFSFNPITLKTQYHEIWKSSGMYQLIDGGKYRQNTNKKGTWRTSESVVSDTGSNKYLFRDPQIDDLFSTVRMNGTESGWLKNGVNNNNNISTPNNTTNDNTTQIDYSLNLHHMNELLIVENILTALNHTKATLTMDLYSVPFSYNTTINNTTTNTTNVWDNEPLLTYCLHHVSSVLEMLSFVRAELWRLAHCHRVVKLIDHDRKPHPQNEVKSSGVNSVNSVNKVVNEVNEEVSTPNVKRVKKKHTRKEEVDDEVNEVVTTPVEEVKKGVFTSALESNFWGMATLSKPKDSFEEEEDNGEFKLKF